MSVGPTPLKGRYGGSTAGFRDQQRTLGGLHIAGVFSGLSNYTVSHRARLPSIHNVYVAAASTTPSHVDTPSSGSGGDVQFIEQALDVRRGVFMNRTRVRGTDGCELVLEQRIYCHRVRRSIMVLEFQAIDSGESSSRGAGSGALGSPSHASAPCTATIRLQHREEVNANGTTDVAFTRFEQAGAHDATTIITGKTRIPELYGSAPTAVSLAFDTVPNSLEVSTAVPSTIYRFVAAVHTDLEGIAPQELAAAAVSTLAAARVVGGQLLAEHESGWQQIWQSGIEVSGNVTVAAAVNASQYYIYSAMREDWPHGLSPGGLATDSYVSLPSFICKERT